MCLTICKNFIITLTKCTSTELRTFMPAMSALYLSNYMVTNFLSLGLVEQGQENGSEWRQATFFGERRCWQ